MSTSLSDSNSSLDHSQHVVDDSGDGNSSVATDSGMHDGEPDDGNPITHRVARNLVAGALGRCMSASLMHPFDVVKTRLQFQIGITSPTPQPHQHGSTYHIRSYKNGLQALRTIAKEEGFTALYRGLPVRLIYITPAAAVSFTVYEQFMRAVRRVVNGDQHEPSDNANNQSHEHKQQKQHQSLLDTAKSWKYPILTLCAGATARVFGTACRTPFDIVKQRLQVEGQIVVNPASGSSKELYRSSLAADSTTPPAPVETPKVDKSLKTRGILGTLRQVIGMEGFRGLWSGYGVTLLRDAPFAAIYFTSYETMKTLQQKAIDKFTPLDHSRAKSLQHLVAGACAGAIASAFTIPIDVVKTRLQTQGKLGHVKYHGIIDAFKTIYREEGLAAFRKGLGPRLTYIMPAAALTFTFYEQFKVLLGVDKMD